MQETDDPDRLREIFETDTSLPFHRRFNLMSQAEKAFLDAGRKEEATKARWDADMFNHHLRTFAKESKGRFGPIVELSDGTVIPDPSIFTGDAFDYYKQRARETNNPVLKSWYADFIWERRQDHVFARMAIEALHETYSLRIEDGDRLHEAADSVVRSLRLARALNDSALVNAAKNKAFQAIRDFMAFEAHPAIRWTLEPIKAVLEGSDVTEQETQILLEAATKGEEFSTLR